MSFFGIKALQKHEERDDLTGLKFEANVGWRMLPYLREHVFVFAVSIVLVFCSAGIALYTPKLLGRIVDQALIPRDMHLLYRLAALYAGLEILRLLCNFTQNYQLQKIGQRVMQSIRMDLFIRLIHMPVPFFDKHPAGKLVTRVTNDTQNLSELFSAGFVMLLSDVLLIVGVISAMLLLHPKLALISVSVFPLMVLTMVVFSGKLRIAFRRARELLSQLNAFFAERMGGMPIVQLMGKEQQEIAAYRALSLEYRNRQFDGVYLYSLFHPAITVLSASSIVLVLLYAPGYIANGEIALGTFVSFLAYVQILYQPVRNITDRYNIFLAAMSSAERIFTLLDQPEEEGLRGKLSKNRSISLEGTLEFDHVLFRYGNSADFPWALNDVSFKIRQGERVAVVGHTGAGKTTLTSLLFRFYDPQGGAISLGGRDLRSYDKRELRERIGFVQQDVFLFAGTIRENLVLLRQGLTDGEILDACRHTGFDRVLRKLPDGLDTLLEERGANLSLGERQILAFTRVFLQRPDILVLDEATSSVDHESELRIQEASEALVRGRTTIVIAHRLSTIRDCDRIFLFEKGRLVEQGTHETLLQDGGLYAKLVAAQERLPEAGTV